MRNSPTLFCFLLSAALLLLAACAPQAQAAPTAQVIYQVVSEGSLKVGSAIPSPKGPVVLTLEGDITQKNVGETLQFDMAMLEQIRIVQYRVDDPFAKKNVLYSGVLLSTLLQIAGVGKNADTLTLWALDDYSADMKISDTLKWPIIIATKLNGAYMPLDQKGPLISVIPFNDFPEIDHVTYDSQWLWALARITVK